MTPKDKPASLASQKKGTTDSTKIMYNLVLIIIHGYSSYRLQPRFLTRSLPATLLQ